MRLLVVLAAFLALAGPAAASHDNHDTSEPLSVPGHATGTNDWATVAGYAFEAGTS